MIRRRSIGDPGIVPSSVLRADGRRISHRGARPQGLQGVRRPRYLPGRARRGRRVPRSAAPTSSTFEPKAIAVGRDMRALLARPWRRPRSRRSLGRRRSGRGRRDDRHRDALLRGRRALGLDGGLAVTASHNPEGVHGHEDRAARARFRVGEASPGCSTSATAPQRGFEDAATPGAVSQDDIYPGWVEQGHRRSSTPETIRPLRVVIDAANGMAGAMLPAVLDRLPDRGGALLLRARRDVPQPRAEPAASPENREFIVAKVLEERRRPRASPSTATPTAASSSTTRASSSPATS